MGANTGVQNCIVDNTNCPSLNSGTGVFTCSGLNALNPLFVNAPAGDLHIMAGSSAIDLAVSGPSVDFDGATRFVGLRYDLGAYEYGAMLPRVASIDPTTVETAPALDMKLFPNPTTDRFTVQFGREVTGRVEVLDMQGRVILTDNVDGVDQIDLAIGGRSSGTYYVRLITDAGILVRAIVLQQP